MWQSVSPVRGDSYNRVCVLSTSESLGPAQMLEWVNEVEITSSHRNVETDLFAPPGPHQSLPGLPKPDSGREWAKQVVFVTCVLNLSRQWFQDLRLKFTLSSTPIGNSSLPSTNPRNKMSGIPEGHLWYREEKEKLLWLTIFWGLGTSHILSYVIFIIALQERQDSPKCSLSSLKKGFLLDTEPTKNFSQPPLQIRMVSDM